MKFLSELTTTPRPWVLLALSAFALELCALYFQYYMGLAPCIMCIYQRVALWGIFIAGVIGAIGNSSIWTRVLAYISWGTGAIWGLLIAVEHVEIQSSDSLFYTCEYVPNFPSWLPLHEWLPWLFEATGDCGDINWQFLDFTMPQMMILVFAVYSLLFVGVLLSRLIGTKKF